MTSSPNAKGDAELVERPKLAWVEFAGNGNVRYWSMDEATARRQIAQGHKLTPFPMVPVAAVADLLAENARLIQGARAQADEVIQTLGKVLGYPWFKDDQTNFPGATEADGICLGDHIAETMAAEAAEAIARLTREVERLSAIVDTDDAKAVADYEWRRANNLVAERDDALREHTDMMWQRRRAEDRASAAEAKVDRLTEALRPFAWGGDWGAWLSWLINGASDRAKGLAAAKQIVKWRATVDTTLSLKETGHGDER